MPTQGEETKATSKNRIKSSRLRILDSMKIDFFELLRNDKLNQSIKKKITDLNDDIQKTVNSLYAKDTLSDYAAKTIALANLLFSERYSHLCDEIFEADHSALEFKIKAKEIFDNAKTRYLDSTKLFYTQKKHSEKFSSMLNHQKVKDVAESLKSEESSPDDLIVHVFILPSPKKFKLYAVNNRTYSALNGAEIDPTRIIPILPTVDHLKRFAELDKVPVTIQSDSPNRSKTSTRFVNDPLSPDFVKFFEKTKTIDKTICRRLDFSEAKEKEPLSPTTKPNLQSQSHTSCATTSTAVASIASSLSVFSGTINPPKKKDKVEECKKPKKS